jgi:hypothetical protein
VSGSGEVFRFRRSEERIREELDINTKLPCYGVEEDLCEKNYEIKRVS